jgi:ABC-type transport system involved in multi-copper enzyme maturation permease subunit
VFGAITVLGLLAVFGSNAVEMRIYGQGIDLAEANEAMGNPMLMGFNVFMYILVFMVVMATAGLIPGMLIKGRAEFYLSKPISRTKLLLNKVLGVWVVYSGMITVCVLINFVAAGILAGALDWAILYIIAINLLAFLVWLGITTFVGILSGSGAVSIMVAFLVWLAQRVLSFHGEIKAFVDSEVVGQTVDLLYYIFPKTIEMFDLADRLAFGRHVDWMPVWSSLIFTVALLYFSTLVFKRRDY